MENNQIGARIRALRKLYKISQKDLYEATGISSGNLNSMETGKTLPSSASLMSLSKLFHCTTDYILFGTDTYSDTLKTEGETRNPSLFLTPNERKLIERYRQMDATGKNEIQLYAYIKTMPEMPSDI